MKIEDLQIYFRNLSEEEREELGDEGLYVDKALMPAGYDASPIGYLAFASTGGDGVHFNVPNGEDGPVVMTVPMAFDAPNIVVGADVEDFLSLGCIYGYFCLEQLAYKKESAIDSIQTAQEPSAALQMLSNQFALKPWPDVGKRLNELQAKYADQIKTKYQEDAQ